MDLSSVVSSSTPRLPEQPSGSFFLDVYRDTIVFVCRTLSGNITLYSFEFLPFVRFTYAHFKIPSQVVFSAHVLHSKRWSSSHVQGDKLVFVFLNRGWRRSFHCYCFILARNLLLLHCYTQEYISMLPNVDHPEAFGQHPNADIASQIIETRWQIWTIPYLVV